MSANINGGPAFPAFHQNMMTGHPLEEMAGMNLRDYFAAKAMQALISAEPEREHRYMVCEAWTIADAMLAARGEPL